MSKSSKRLTKREKALLIKAAKIIDSGEEVFSCTAIDSVHREVGPRYYLGTDLRIKYADFYEQGWLSNWSGLYSDNRSKEARVLLLLNFAEVG